MIRHVLAFLVLLTLTAGLPSSRPPIDLGYTSVPPTSINQTARGHQVNIYKNVRFAAPPTGTLRFKYPVSPTSSSSVDSIPIDTQCISSVPAEAPFPGINGTTFGSEDCLFLDVYVPGSLPTNTTVPVIHLLYGSAYASGSKEIFANPMGLFDELLSNDVPFIFVASNYRMGLYGWASSPDEMSAMDTNVGLADGLAALEWTKKNINKFGGDPKQVTAMGQSAGSGMIELMIANYHANPLPFTRAFLSSSDMPLKSKVTKRRQALYSDMLRLANCTNDGIICLQQLPDKQLAEVNDILVSKTPAGGGGGTFGPYLGFGPFVDGRLIHNLSSITLRSHPNDHVLDGLVIGNMQSEAERLSSDQGMPSLFASLVRKVLPTASNHTISRIKSLYTYPASLPEKLAWDWTADMAFYCHSLSLAKTYANRTYRYVMSAPPAVHAQDLGYYFYPDFNLGLPVNAEVARGFQRMLGEFIHVRDLVGSVDGNKEEGVMWNEFGEERKVLNITADGFEMRRADNGRVERCDVLDGIFEDARNGI